METKGEDGSGEEAAEKAVKRRNTMMKRTSTITEIMPADIQTVWGIVTDNEHYHWRSDLERIDVLDGGERFIEYTKDGFSTEFIITRIRVPAIAMNLICKQKFLPVIGSGNTKVQGQGRQSSPIRKQSGSAIRCLA